MEDKDIVNDQNVNTLTHPFLETYRYWVCEARDPAFIMGEADFVNQYPNQVRCC